MNIGFDAKRAFSNFTGLGNYSRSLIKNLVDFYPGHNYFLYTPSLKKNPFNELIQSHENIKVMTPGPLSNFFSSAWRSFGLKRVITKNKLDIYHGLSHEIPYQIHKTNIKSVVTIHDLIYYRFPHLFPYIDRTIYDLKFRYACQHANKIVAISNQTKSDIINFFGVDEKKINVVYQTCDDIFTKTCNEHEKREVSKKYHLPSEFVLYVGSLTERKNALGLVRAQNALQKNLKFPLVIIGDGKEYKRELIEYINRHKLYKHILLLDSVEFKDLPAIYQQSKLFVYPSIFEGFGIPIIEAIHSKVPVITSTGSCFKEAGGEKSIYVDPHKTQDLASAIELALTDETRRSEMIKSGLVHMKMFHKEKVTNDLFSVYHDLTLS